MSQNDRQILRDLFVELHEKISWCNPYVQQFQLAKDIDVEEEQSLVFHPDVPTGSHERVYNAPTHELCVCVTDDIDTKYPPLILRRNTTYLENNPSVTELQIVHDCHPLYDLIRYLFFFPDGGEGWHPSRRNRNGGKLSIRQYYKFLLHERPEQYHRITGNSILQGQRLMMEFVVMAYIREQEQKLRWVRQHQQKLRAETYKTLCKNVEPGN